MEVKKKSKYFAYRPQKLGCLLGVSSMEVGLKGDNNYIYRYTVTTRMTPALRWTVMRAILMFH